MATLPAVSIAPEVIAKRIFIVRGQKVILDADLAALYEVPTKRFNEAVKRNLAKFPADFMFALTPAEWDALRSQFATLKVGRGQHRKYLPYVFTEHGAIMAATLLSSPRAVQVSVYVVRAFLPQPRICAYKPARTAHRNLADVDRGLLRCSSCDGRCAFVAMLEKTPA